MNRSIIRLFGVMIVLFTVLIVWTSRWTVFSATALNHNPLNQLSYYASLKVKRGQILADDGTVLAKSRHASGGTWKREYPEGSLFSQAVGYYFPLTVGSAGIEAARNDALQGPQSVLTSVFGSFNGTPKVGDDVHTTLDPTAQTQARQLLDSAVSRYGATAGSVVAMVPKTGAVKVMYSNPTYNDNDPKAPCGVGCLVNYATQSRLPPGSTFKLVTTAAALDTGKYTPDSVINGHGPIMVSGHPLQNDSGEEYGDVTLSDALTNSINVVYAQVGEALGANVMQDYMERFGFYSYPPMDYPVSQMVRSGELFYPGSCRNNKNLLLLPVTDPCVDLGRTAIGQANLAVTPLQMAMVVSAIANKGTLMQPRLASKVVNQEGQVVQAISPQEDDQVMKPKVASEMSTMMRNVVEEGTGQTANLEGQTIAGKTGTASTGGTQDGQPLDDAWFVGFAPVADPKIAVAVELTSIKNGYGGQYAAPIAAQVIKTLLAEGQ
jgi:peptidoglycan glycosyltransferase